MPRLVSLWRNVVRRRRVEQELDDEVRAAFDLLVDEKSAAGMPPEEARRAAALQLGRVHILKEQIREATTGASLDTWLQDVRYGARLLRRNPLFALTAALSLAIGIGANTAIFTIANALLFRAPAGVSVPDRLLDIFRAEEGRTMANFTVSYAYYREVRQRATKLAGLYAYEFDLQPVNLAFANATELAFGNLVTGSYFGVLGVIPAAGRLLDAADDTAPGASPVVVLSHRFWARRFNRDAGVIGQTIHINRHPFTVIGVSGQGFKGTNVMSPDLWIPMSMADVVQPGSGRLANARQDGLGMGGRLAAGVSRAQAAAELDAIARALEREDPFVHRGTRLRVASLSSVPGPVAKVAAGFFGLLLALVSVVLVIACANIAGVLLARAAARRREIAVRIAIGAGKVRLVRQLLTETMLLFVLAGSAGFLLARGLTALLLKVLPAFPQPVELALPIDVRVLLFTAVLALVAAVLSGLTPAMHAARADVVSALKDESQGPPDRLRTRSAFVIAQVAFSIALVVVAGLLVRALERTSSVDQGFDPRGVDVASLDLTTAGYTTATGRLFARDLATRLRSLPGIESATLTQYMPGHGGALARVTVAGVAPPEGGAFFTAIWNAADPGYFATLRLPLVSGRDFAAADHATAQPVAVVSESTARRFWPGEDPIGKYIVWHDADPSEGMAATRLQVVGVARDVKSAAGRSQVRELRTARRGDHARLPEPPPPVNEPVSLMMYLPLQQRFTQRLTILTRASAGRRAIADVRELVRSMDPNLPLLNLQPLDAQTGPGHLQLRVAAAVAGSVGLVGLLLAAIGIYGVTAYTTARRTREIGIRVAMGAQRSDVLVMVLRHGMSLVLIGTVAGLMLAAAGSRLFARLLFGVPPFDPVTFAAAAVLFALIGLSACYLPAHRATRIDAIKALRYE